MSIEPDFEELEPQPVPTPEDPAERAGRNKKASLLSGLVWTFGRTVGIAIIQFSVVLAASHKLSPTQLGWAQAAFVLNNLATMIAQVGITGAIIQRKDLDNRHLSTAMIASIAGGLLQALIMLAGAGLIAKWFNLPGVEPYLRVISIIFVVNAIARTAWGRLSRDLRFHQIAKAELTATIAYGGVAIALAILGRGAWSIIIGLIVGQVTLCILLMIGEPIPRPFRYSTDAMKDLRQVARGFSVATILTYIAGQADNFIVSSAFGAAALGLYSRVSELMARPASLVANSVNRVLFPTMSREQEDRERLTKLYQLTTTGMAAAILPLGFVCAVLAPDIILGLLKPKFAPVIIPFQILSAGMIFRVGFQSSDAITKASGDAFGRVGPRIAYLICVIAFGYLGTKAFMLGDTPDAGTRLGLIGVSIGIVLANLTHVLLMAKQSLKHVNSGWADYLRTYQGPLVVALAAAGAAWVASYPLRQLHVPHLLILFLGFIVAGGVGMFVIRCGNAALLSREFVEIREMLFKRMKGKLKRRRKPSPQT